MNNYPIASFLIQIKNAYMARKKATIFPHSKILKSIGDILVKEGYVKSIKTTNKDNKKNIEVELLYHGHEPSIKEVRIISKPSIHKYIGKEEVKKRVSRFKINILSTNQGVMTAKEAAKKNIGGELICTIE